MFPVAWTQRLARELMPLQHGVDVIDRASEGLVWAVTSSFGYSFIFSVVEIEWLKLLLSVTTRVTCQSREKHKENTILNSAVIFFFRMNLWWKAGMEGSVEETGEGRRVHVKERKGSVISHQIKPCNYLMIQQVCS